MGAIVLCAVYDGDNAETAGGDLGCKVTPLLVKDVASLCSDVREENEHMHLLWVSKIKVCDMLMAFKLKDPYQSTWYE